MLLSAGLDNLILAAVVPESKAELVSAAEWVEAALKVVNATPKDGASKTVAYGEFKCDRENGQFPIKLLDTAKSAAFAFLRSKGQVQDESSDDEPGFQFDD